MIIEMTKEIKAIREEGDVFSLYQMLSEGLIFQKQTYTEIKNKLIEIFDFHGEERDYWANYQFSKFKEKKKEFASWFVNMDDRFWSAILLEFGIELEYPEIEISAEVEEHLAHHDSQAKRNLQISLCKMDGTSDWFLYPREYVLLKKFCVYSLNHSSLSDFENNDFPKPKGNLYNFKGWANYFLTRLSESKRVIFVDFLMDY